MIITTNAKVTVGEIAKQVGKARILDMSLKGIVDSVNAGELVCLSCEAHDEPVNLEASVHVSIEAFDDDDVAKDYARRFSVEPDIIGEIYAKLAAGDVGDAMDQMAREFRLAPPVPRNPYRRPAVARQGL